MSKYRKNETAKRLTDKKQRGLVFFHLLTNHHTGKVLPGFHFTEETKAIRRGLS